MPDISMCKNAQCPHSANCYRFRAHPSQRQSYANFAPDAWGVCPSLMQIAPRDPKDVRNAP